MLKNILRNPNFIRKIPKNLRIFAKFHPPPPLNFFQTAWGVQDVFEHFLKKIGGKPFFDLNNQFLIENHGFTDFRLDFNRHPEFCCRTYMSNVYQPYLNVQNEINVLLFWHAVVKPV